MALFKKLFNRDKTRNAAETKKPAAAKPSGHQAILNEKDPEQRLSLINAITDESELESLIREANRDIRQQAESVWISRLAPAGALPSNADDSTLIRIASLTRDDSLAKSAIAKIGDEPARLTLAKEHTLARVRLAAAETVTSESALIDLQKHAQGKDKAVYRHCKDALAAIQAEQAARQQTQDKIDYIRSNADTLLRLGYGPEFTGKVQILQQRWQELEGKVSDFDVTDIPELLSQLERILKAQKEEEQQAIALAAEQEEATKTQEAVLAQAQQLLQEFNDDLNAEALESVTTQQAALTTQWAATTEKHPALASQQKQFEHAIADINTVITTLQYLAENADITGTLTPEQARTHLPNVAWPHSVETPTWLESLRKAAGEKRKAPKPAAPKQDDKDTREKVEGLINELETALEARIVNDAANALKQIHRLNDKLTPKTQNQLQGRLRLLTNQLNELRDWQGFAVTPKKESLCEQMEVLIDADIAPDLLAERIKELQSEWKSLGHSNDRDLWQRFQDASDKAFEPCKAHFAEQAEQRGKLVTLREQLIEELRHYEANMDWDSADWKTVQNTLNAARDTFRSYSPVDRSSHQKTQKAFNTVCDAIYAHLKAEYDRNLDQKRALVDAAEAAANSDDMSAAAEQVKKIQQDWKSVGVTPRGPDQKLWNQLRKHADTVFSKLNDARDARKAEINETVATAEAIVETARQNAATEGMSAIVEARGKLAEIELPKGAHGRLVKALNDVEERLNSERNAAKVAQEQERWNALLGFIESGTQPDAETTLPEGIDAEWFAQNRESPDSLDASKLCITMEILADIDSPASDKGQRMELQVQRLAEGMGRNLSKHEERNALIKQWLSAEADSDLTQRFVTALKAAI
ncbi:DUF349 domain-containing protein [Thalassolituus sp.]|uniref:DUF349 domain-containing protein n=1 Tax=Thalassolituus sp. TaxID=2030822 RepID=UPI0035175E85